MLIYMSKARRPSWPRDVSRARAGPYRCSSEPVETATHSATQFARQRADGNVRPGQHALRPGDHHGPAPRLPYPGTGATGYAVQVSPGTAHLKAILSNGTSELVAPRVVDGRKYVAFVVSSPLRLSCLIWFSAAGQAIASITALPPYGYLQFQP
jgi:hypothetical protein